MLLKSLATISTNLNELLNLEELDEESLECLKRLSPYTHSNLRALSEFVKKTSAVYPDRILDKEFSLFLDDDNPTLSNSLAFSPPANRGNFAIVDPIMIRSNFYLDDLLAKTEGRPRFSDRQNKAYWRGALTGKPVNLRVEDKEDYIDRVTSLQRVLLCKHSARSDFLLDAKLTSANQWGYAEDIVSRLRSMEIFTEPEPFTNNFDYRYLIDVDGNSNSWPGFFMKLGTGSCVIKVASAHGYSQWYYDRITEWRHYVPVRADLSDLQEKLDYLIRNSEIAHKIAQNARLFVFSRTKQEWAEAAAMHLACSVDFFMDESTAIDESDSVA